MICTKCHTPNSETARFCRGCGAALFQTQTAGAVSAQHPAHAPTLQATAPQDESAAKLIGYVIDGKYRLEAPLGAGGMGLVYRATRLHIGDAVAVKLLQPQMADDAEMLERFRREAQAAARLKHPNVVTIHDFGRAREGWLYLVMELVEGQSLRAMLGRRTPVSPATATEIVVQICSALDEAHRRQIVHRDLKPDNIIVMQTSRGLSVKVLDFGIARWRDLTAGAGTLTATGAVIGTPQYMSPEQCLGVEVDGRADIYSLGVMLYEMLAGSLPFNSPTPGALIAQHVHQQPSPLRAINLQVPPMVEAVVMRALEKRPEARPQTASEFAQQLTAALNGAAASASTQLDPSSAVAATGATPEKASGGQRLEINLGGAPAVGHAPPAARKARTAWLLVFVLLLAGGAFALWQWTSTNQQRGGASLNSQTFTTAASAPLDLSRTSLAQALAQAEAEWSNGRYGEAVASCRGILATVPDQPRATALLGQSLFNLGSPECLSYLTRALALGETVALPVKHHHYEGVLKINDGFCDGEMILKRGEMRFQSSGDSSHSFDITPRSIIDLRNYAHKSGRVYTKLSLPQGGMELKQTYNFYPAVAVLQQNRMRTAVRCDSPACQATADALYQLLRQFQQ